MAETKYVVQRKFSDDDRSGTGWVDVGVYSGHSGIDAMKAAAQDTATEGEYRAFPERSDVRLTVAIDRTPRFVFEAQKDLVA